MTQLKLIQTEPQRVRQDYPQMNRVDQNNVQWIEINRGCKRKCSFCYADPNYKVFDVPEITRNIVQIVGEGILYDPDIKQKIIELGKKRVNGKVVYYGLSQGFDFRLFDKELAELFSKNRIGIINNKGRWYKGIRFAWDGVLNHEELTKQTIDLLKSVGYSKRHIQIFVLVNWKIPYSVCLQKLMKLKEWKVKIDDCTYNTTKREKNPIFWTKKELVDFRRLCRKHNQLIMFRGYDPEQKPLTINKKEDGLPPTDKSVGIRPTIL